MSTQKVVTFIEGEFSTVKLFKPYDVTKELAQNEIYYFYFNDDEGRESCVQCDVYAEPTFFTVSETEVEDIDAQ